MRMQCHESHGGLAGRVLPHDPDRAVDIAVDAKAAARGDRQEPEHVTARDRGNEGLLRIHGGRGGKWHPDYMRRRGRGHLDATVEMPRMRAAVAIVGERGGTAAP